MSMSRVLFLFANCAKCRYVPHSQAAYEMQPPVASTESQASSSAESQATKSTVLVLQQ